MNLTELQEDMKVHYVSSGKPALNGMVKTVSCNRIFVVYHCAGDWVNFRNYTSQLTPIVNLRKGWI